MPKKPIRNSFYFFMIDFREEQRKKGIVYQNMTEVAQAAGPAWASAPPPLRAKYEEQAKREKKKQNVPENKFTSTGISLAEIERQQQEQKEAMEAERNDIMHFIRQKSINRSIVNEDIFLMDVNYYCKYNSQYIIGELTLLRFTLQDGIKDTYHELIYPGKPPVGYALEVKQGCKEFGLEMPDEHPTTNFIKVLANVVDYLKQQDPKMRTPPAVYTMPDKVDPVLYFIQLICQHAHEDDSLFRVYKLDTLFYMLSNAGANSAKEGFPKESLALLQLKKDTFKYTPGLACEMHEAGDVPVECTLSRVKRWAYTVLDWCCPPLGVTAVPGSHVPADFDLTAIMVCKEQRRGAAMPSAGPRVQAKLDESACSSHNNTADTSHSALHSSLDEGVPKKEKRKHVPVRMPATNIYYSNEFSAPPELSLNSDTEFPELSSAGRGRGLSSSFKGLKFN